MTAIATPARRSPAATKAEGVVRTARHLYYFNGSGPWPGVTSITRVLDAPALTNWKLGEVARSAVENAERLVDTGERPPGYRPDTARRIVAAKREATKASRNAQRTPSGGMR